MFNRKTQRAKRHLRLRQRVIGTAEKPRMSICVTNKHMYVQFIDDSVGKTLASASTIKEKKANLETAKALGAAAAEAAKAAFVVIKSHMAGSGNTARRGPIVIATVHGDIHDIGKNIVKLLLENYGFDVIDLGKDVPPEAVVDAVVARHAPLAGLSALMTTTTPAMKETVALLSLIHI